MPAERRPTILVVDDERANIELLDSMLQADYDIQFAFSGRAALELASASPPDLILLDVLMPDLDGYEAMARLQADPRLRRIPVFFITARGDEDAERKGLALGAADYVSKPINPESLRLRIKNQLARHRLLEDLELALRGANQGLWSWWLQPDEVEFHPDWTQPLGHPPGTMAPNRLPWSGIVHPEDLPGMLDRVRTILAGGGDEFTVEARLRHRSGDWVWMQISGKSAGWDAAGRPVVLKGVYVDISRRKREESELEEHRHHLQDLVQQRTAELLAAEVKASLILESTADGVFGIDLDGRAIFINPAACRMLGYTQEQVLGRHIHGLIHHSRPDGAPYPADDCPSGLCLHTGQTARVDDEVYWHADGHPIPVMYATHPMIRNGAITGAVVSFVDLSERRAAEEAREQALVAAENLARARQEFLANMSHEIRTPLNGILGFTRIGLSHSADEGKVRESLERIRSSGQWLLEIVNDVLDFSKGEQGGFSIEAIPLDLAGVLEQVSRPAAEMARLKGLDFNLAREPGLPETCLGDPLRLKQILSNLLSNALKFTEAGSLGLSVGRAGDLLVFEVRDTGIGIREEQLGRLFSPFEQGDSSTTRRYGGSGLGLAIARRLVEAMNGRIEVRSTPGVGSRFEVRLPYRPAPAAERPRQPLPPEPEPGLAPSLAGVRILVAEDNEINQCVLTEMLEQAGAEVVLASTGEQAVACVAREGADAFDLVLMDISMPVMDGFEATRRLRAIAPRLPVIAQTAHALPEEQARCLAAGMAAHIAKPIDPVQLRNMVARHARRRANGDRHGS